jgi:atypical dual specificity phosphatase
MLLEHAAGDERHADRMARIARMLDAPAYSRMEPSLYLGAIEAVEDGAFMATVGAVLSLTSAKAVDYVKERLAPGTHHKQVVVHDTPDTDLRQHFEACRAFIEHHLVAGRIVLVHCMRGRSRSAAVVAYYLMRAYPESLGTAFKALEYVKERRCIARPNDGFVEQLVGQETQ